MPKKNEKESNDKRAEYLDERKLLIQLKDGAIQRFDQTLITLSSSFIGFSFIIIKDVVKNTNQTSKILIVAAWFCWCVSLSSVLYSFWRSEGLLEKQMDDAEDLYVEKEISANSLGKSVKLLNKISFVSFFIGVILFIIFGALNFLFL